MSFDAQILGRVLATRLARAVRRETQAAERREAVFTAVARIEEIHTEMRLAAINEARAAIMRAAQAGMQLAPEDADALRSELNALLAANGYASDALETGYDCRECRDTGYIAGAPCACLIADYAAEQTAELERALNVRQHTFERFELGLFSPAFDAAWGISPRENMQNVLDICKEFCAKTTPRNLLLSGPPGTGKTFLAACVAAEVTRQGRSVICRSAPDVFALYEKAKFTYDGDMLMAAEVEINRLQSTDLLIMDNLGAEFKAPFVNAALLALVEARLRGARRTMICTGLDEENDIPKRYTPQIASRLSGEYLALPLFGHDLRRID